ncbi:DDE-type integrase/transposase/recombinase [Roseomonas xinghualingensis]|uniref:DDE-type integrase/transposase/recombinase n=1 Tax=Roseomonas xinghualingensis TaxID=2986475 RepID=UPI0021F1B66F|nr:DDE-type integrase/transposase/recombinase [Roseomonas sp. SXEYE001]MCV4210171.1 DDE-type integrase/transposase/recombinase [Roseomonas sp. SXEYE001]
MDRGFSADGPDQKQGSDVSSAWTCEGWLLLAVVIDLFARRVAGWAVSDRLHRDGGAEDSRKAITMRRPLLDMIHHADRGSQYCSMDYQAELRKHSFLIWVPGRPSAATSTASTTLSGVTPGSNSQARPSPRE